MNAPAEPDEVVLTALPDPIAQVVAGALVAADIPARCRRDGLGAVYGLSTGAFATRVLVPQADLARARELLAQIEAEEP